MREQCQLQGHTGQVWSVNVSHDSRRVLSGSDDHSVRLCDLDNGREVFWFIRRKRARGLKKADMVIPFEVVLRLKAL